MYRVHVWCRLPTTSEKVKIKILKFLLNAGKANAKTLEQKAECANKTFLKVRKQLEKEGLIKKDYEPKPDGGIYAQYYIPDDKLRDVKNLLEKEELKQRMSKYIDNATPQEIEELKKALQERDRKIEKLQEAVVKPFIESLEKEFKIAKGWEKFHEDILDRLNTRIQKEPKVGRQAKVKELIKEAEESAIYWKNRVLEIQEEIEKLKKFLEE